MSLAVILHAGMLTANVPCGKRRTVYTNDAPPENVVIQITAGCSGGASVIIRGNATTARTYNISSGETHAFRVPIATGGAIDVDCRGTGAGSCSYMLSVPD